MLPVLSGATEANLAESDRRRLAAHSSLRSQRPESGGFHPPVLITDDLEKVGTVDSARRAAKLHRIEYLVQVQEQDSRILKDPGRKENHFSRDQKGDTH